jgi:Zn-dependent peptidase ImmA (M78 family)
VQEWLERYVETERLLAEGELGAVVRFEMPGGFPRQVRGLDDAEDAAHQLREVWDLGQDPIENMTALLEDKGIRVGSVDGHRDFDACTFWADAEEGERIPVIAVRSNLPGDRQRFSLAHELAHLLLEFLGDWVEGAIERAASRFAAAFLVPAAAARFELGPRRHTVSLYELHMLKHKYGLSMQAWIYRGKDLGILSDEAADRLLQPFQGLNWETDKEPGDPFPSEAPTRLERMVMRALSEDFISERRASELLGKPFSQFSEEVVKEHDVCPLAACV